MPPPRTALAEGAAVAEDDRENERAMGGRKEEREKCGRDLDKYGVGGARYFIFGVAIFVCGSLNRPARIIFVCGSVKWPAHEN